MIVNLLTTNEQDIDTDASGWTAVTNCTLSRSTTRYRIAPAALKLSPVSVAGATMQVDLTRSLTVVAGTNYRAFAFFRNDTPGTAVGITPRMFDATGTLIDNAVWVAANKRTTSSVVFGRWNIVSTEFTAPVGAVTAKLRLDAAPTTEGIWFDQIGLVEWAERPVNKFMDLVLQNVPRYMLEADEDLASPDHPLLRYLDLVASTADNILTTMLAFDYISPVDNVIGYDRSTLVQPEYYPTPYVAEAHWLPWLSQIVGVSELTVNSAGTLTPWYWFETNAGTWNLAQTVDPAVNPVYPITSVTRDAATGVVTAVLGAQTAGPATPPTVGMPVEIAGTVAFNGSEVLTSVSGTGPYTVTWTEAGAAATEATGTVTLSDVSWSELERKNPQAFDSLEALKQLTSSRATGLRAGSRQSLEAAARVALDGYDVTGSATRSANVVTVTCDANHSFTVGSLVVLYLCDEPTLNLEWVVDTVVNDRVFTVASPGPDKAATSCRVTNKKVNVVKSSRWNWSVNTLSSQTFAADLLTKAVNRAKPAGVVLTTGTTTETATEVVLKDALVWLDPSAVTATNGFTPQLWPNKGRAGSVLDTQAGTNAVSSGAYIRNGVLQIPGTTGNYASVPDSSPLDITGDIELVCRASLSSFTTDQYMLNKNGTTTGGGYALMVLSTGFFAIRWSNGTSTLTATPTQSLTAAGLSTGTTYWWKGTLDVNNGASGYQARLYWAADSATEPATWNEFTAPAPGSPATAIAANNLQLGIGAWYLGTSAWATGGIRRAIVRNGIGGTTVLDVDFSSQQDWVTQFVETSSTGSLVTVNTTNLTFDPAFLPALPAGYACIKAGSNYLSTAAAQTTGATQLDVRMVVARDSWPPSATDVMCAQAVNLTTPATFGWAFVLTNTGALALWMGDGTNTPNSTTQSSATIVAPRFGLLAVRATYVPTTGVIQYFTKATTATTCDADIASNTGWVQLGTDRTGLTLATGLIAGAQLGIGGYSFGGANMFGKVFATQVATTIDGAPFFQMLSTNFTSSAATTVTATSGQTVTVNRTTTGSKLVICPANTVGGRSKWLLTANGSSLDIPDTDGLLDLTVGRHLTAVIVLRQFATPGATGRYLSKRDPTTPNVGWEIAASGGTTMVAAVDDGPNSPSSGTGITLNTAGAVTMYGILVNGTKKTITGITGTTTRATSASTASVGDTSNAFAVRIGNMAGSTGSGQDLELYAVAIWDRPLTVTEQTLVANYYASIA